MIKVISYYSPEYAKYAQRLTASLVRFSCDYQVVNMPKFRSWHDGVSFKPTYIMHAMDNFTSYDGVLWLDADCYLKRALPWDELAGADIAATRFRWSPSHKNEMLTGTLYFANNQKTRLLVEQWAGDTKKYSHSDTPEQDSLLYLVQTWGHSILFKDLGIDWTYIDDPLVKQQYPKADPIVVHTQASREVKKLGQAKA